MKKLLISLLCVMFSVAMAAQIDGIRRSTTGTLTFAERKSVDQTIDQSNANVTAIALRATLASPTFTGTVTLPSPFKVGATSVTTTGTKLNYLTGATGTTGTATTNLVYSASPTFTGTVILPILNVGGAILLQNNAQIENAIDGLMTITEPIVTVMGKLTASEGISLTSTVTEYTTIVTIDSTKIAGIAAGDLGHADGAILVASPGTGYTQEFVSAFIIYDHSTADFAGGGNNLVVNVGVTGTQVAVSSAITAATLLTASADAIIHVNAIATEVVYADNGAISLFAGSAYTNNGGTAAGQLRVHLTYRVHTTGL